MPQRSKKSGFATSPGSMPEGSDKTYSQIDRQLAGILSSLAHLLLRHGYGHGRLASLAKIAFVDAARLISTKLNSKTNIARIATLTGLTRLEVSRILRTDRAILFKGDPLNRASRVAVGWQTDKTYLDRRGRPRPLPFSGSRVGFPSLVKKYSGDIPARAMLAEMTRLGLVGRTDEQMISLIRNAPVLPSLAISTFGAITPWVNFLADASNSLTSAEMSSQAQQIKIHFSSLSEVIAATRELSERQRSFVAGIQQLGTTNKPSGAYQVTVSVAVATTRPTRATRKRERKEQ